jgi:hypothetical protein
MKRLLLVPVLLVVSVPALARMPCEELKSTIAAGLDAKHVTGYTLEIVAKGESKDGKVVGTCDGGTREIVYSKGAK